MMDAKSAEKYREDVDAQRSAPGSRRVDADMSETQLDVSIESAPVLSGTGFTLIGTWDWEDDVSGIDAPVDIAALTYEVPDCPVELYNYGATARVQDGTESIAPTLNNGGLGVNFVAWNVTAEKALDINLADHGAVSVDVSTPQCAGTTIAGAFSYEANRGGSGVTVGASAGVGLAGVSVSYETDPEKHFQLGSEISYNPLYAHLVKLDPVYQDFSNCVAAGSLGISFKKWTSYQCRKTTPSSPTYNLWVDYV